MVNYFTYTRQIISFLLIYTLSSLNLKDSYTHFHLIYLSKRKTFHVYSKVGPSY